MTDAIGNVLKIGDHVEVALWPWPGQTRPATVIRLTAAMITVALVDGQKRRLKRKNVWKVMDDYMLEGDFYFLLWVCEEGWKRAAEVFDSFWDRA